MQLPDKKGKVVVILSNVDWGKMLLSKMHYALEMAADGYKVYFVNPPKDGMSSFISIDERAESGAVTVLQTRSIKGHLFFRYKAFFLYKILMSRYARAIKKIVGEPIEEVWCFDPHTYPDLHAFGARHTMMLMYDFYKGDHIVHATNTADLVVSVSQLILDHFNNVNPPTMLLNHGLGDAFAQKAKRRLDSDNLLPVQDSKIRIGYVGNLLRPGMNTEIAREIIAGHPDKEFHFWGPSSLENNNLSFSGEKIAEYLVSFIEFLQHQPNVMLHGIVGPEQLSSDIQMLDAFLFLYNANADINAASNSHKLIEYLSTGKAVISTFVSHYKNTDLLTMCAPGEDGALPAIFKEVMDQLPVYNSSAKQRERIKFALDNTYRRQIDRIHEYFLKKENKLLA